MKNTILAFFIISSLNLFGQIPMKIRSVGAWEWSNEKVFELSQPPIIKGLGQFSDSLTNVYGVLFYSVGSDYYRITTWADYYLWFTKKFPQFFVSPEMYQFFYDTKDDISMASYIASHRYKGSLYPSLITIDFKGGFLNNRLSNNRYLAMNEKKQAKLNSDLINSKFWDINNNGRQKEESSQVSLNTSKINSTNAVAVGNNDSNRPTKVTVRKKAVAKE